MVISAEDPNIYNYITPDIVPKIFQKNGLDKYFVKQNECIFEFTEYKNLYLLYPSKIFDMSKVQTYIDEIKYIFLEMLLKTYNEKFLKLLDIKIVLYLPIDISLTQFYKAGPLHTTVYGVELTKDYNWYEYVLKMNQFIYTNKNQGGKMSGNKNPGGKNPAAKKRAKANTDDMI